MSAKMLIETFDRVIDAPGASSQLRRFVLGMAVRGLLVEQDFGDGNASAILEKATIPQLARSRRATLSTEFPDLSESPYELPDGWVWCRLNQVGLIIGGGTPPSGDAENFTAGGSGISWLTPADMASQTGLEVEHGVRDLTEKGLRSSSATLMPQGTVLFTSRAPIGYVGVAAQDITTNQGFKSLVPSSAVDPRYAAIYFRAFAPAIDAAAPGTTFKEVSGKIVSKLLFPLPPLPEQRRIIARVEELMTLCDQLELAQKEREAQRDALRDASLYRLTSAEDAEGTAANVRFFLDKSPRLMTKVEHVAELRQATLVLAVRGRLVPQDQEEDPALVTLERVYKQKLEEGLETGRDWVGSTKAPEDSQFSLPLGWAWSRIGTTVQRVTVGYVGPMTSQYAEHGVPFLRSQNVRADRFRWEGLISIRPEFHQTILKSSLAPGDVVIVRSGNVGTACVIPDQLPEANCSDLVIAKNPMAVHPRFLSFYLNSLGSEHVEAGTVGMALTHFNTKSVATMPIPLPPLAEQGRIVTKVDEMMAVCDELEAALASAHEERVRLLVALLHDSLNGSEPRGSALSADG